MAEKGEFVIDSSVVTKWFIGEHNSGQAVRIRDDFAAGKIKLSAPTLLFYEVMNALRFSGAFKADDLVLASRSLSKYQFEVWRPRGKLLEISTQISVRWDVTVYDACYIALAQRIGSKVITEDKELLRKFPKLAISMDRPSDFLG